MSTASLNVIGLISGGKDSLYSLLHCIQNGHNIVALANLYPPAAELADDKNTTAASESEDLNSFMYQTVGHTVIPLYAEALGLPLFRREIRGGAVNTSREYVFADGGPPDETEDLIPLLQMIRKCHPDVNAVSTGAILSTYQRTRIESIALRLELTPLAYLWQYPALPAPLEREDSMTGLLDDMEAVGCDARLIKLSSAGVKESLLWSRVSNPVVKRLLLAGMSPFVNDDGLELRGAILGEGGEYETLAISGPPPLWRKRIEIDSRKLCIVRDEGGSSRLTFGEPVLIDQSQPTARGGLQLVRVPVLLDDRFRSLRGKGLCTEDALTHQARNCSQIRWKCAKLSQIQSRFAESMEMNNVTDPNRSPSIKEQAASVLAQFDNQLQHYGAGKNATRVVLSTSILLSDMADFAELNAIYGKRFNHVNPPSRVTICCGDALPSGILVSMSFVLAFNVASKMKGLHVQSISYWAPANIGQYSQAISVPASTPETCQANIVHLAGQIPLVPSTMQLYVGDFQNHTILALQHLWRVGQCVGVDWWTHGVAYLADAAPAEIEWRARVAWEIWRGANAATSDAAKGEGEEDSDTSGEADAWDLKFNHQMRQNPIISGRTTDSHRHTLPNHSVFIHTGSSSATAELATPPFLAAHVSSLPRSAPIEWHSLGLAHLPKYPISAPRLSILSDTDENVSFSTCRLDLVVDDSACAEDESDSEDRLPSTYYSAATESPMCTIIFFSIQLFTPSEQSSPLPEILEQRLQSVFSRLEKQLQPQQESDDAAATLSNLTIYICSQLGYDALTSGGIADHGSVVPCHSLWGAGGRRLEMVVTGQVGQREREKSR